ncbi:MAG TPA: methyltransferase domain-containing protein [Chitinophagaceae bacterium]|nr:methyltransferase domain-containing protein [Chitinophagaceae bacterium]
MGKGEFYEYARIADRKRLDFIAKVLVEGLPAGGIVLDVGCGNGVISRHLGRQGFQVLGIDVSEKAISKARELNTQPKVNFEVMSAEQLAATGMTYDAVVCSEVLEHLQDPASLLNILHSTLKDGGKLIVTVPNGRGPREALVTRPVLHMRSSDNYLWQLLKRLKKALGYQGSTVQSSADNLDHVQFFSKNDLYSMSRTHQFRITRFGKANFIEDVFPFSWFTRRIPWLQKLDCKVADILPAQLTGGFFTVWEKVISNTPKTSKST